MEAIPIVYPPNKQLERAIYFSKSPVIYDYLQFIDFSSSGDCIVGSASVNCTLWENCTLYFKSGENIYGFQYSGFYIGPTVSDGKFLNEDIVLLAEDSAALNVLKVNKENNTFTTIDCFKHFNRIPQISVWNNDSKVVTCSGRDLLIWDINKQERNPLQSFVNYHGEYVNSVDCQKSDHNMFASAATDRKACLWDVRDPSPLSVIYQNEFSALTSIVFNQNNDNYVFIGTEAGDVYKVDKRGPSDFVSVCRCFDKSVYRLSSQKHLAVCGDTNEVLVLSDNLKIVYNNEEHSNVVRGLAWLGNDLYSCGFDKVIKKHAIDKSSDEI